MTATIGYHNLLEASGSTITVSPTETAGYEKENAFDHLTSDHWLPASVAAYIHCDAGASVTVDYFGLGAHDISTQGGTIVLQHATDSAFTTPVNAFTAITPTDDKPLIRTFTAITARYWRVYLTGVAASIGHVSFGDRLDLPLAHGSGYQPLDESRDTKKTITISATGQTLGSTIERQGASGSISIRNMTDTWRRANWEALATHLDTGKLFFFCNDIENYPEETTLCWLPGKVPTPSYDGNLRLSASLRVKGLNR